MYKASVNREQQQFRGRLVDWRQITVQASRKFAEFRANESALRMSLIVLMSGSR